LVKRGNGYKDLTSQRFGRLVVIKDSEQRQGRRVLWLCQCDCGNTSVVLGKNLLKGNTKSCGCLSKEVRGITLRKDKSGQIFGRLLVVGCIGSASKKSQWLCKCDCGKYKIISGSDLATGKAVSCGCYQLERRTGENSHLWRGGISKEPYSVEWNGTLKKEIRSRDNQLCQICGKESEGRKLSIHHIDYNKKNNNQYNLISLCSTCHTKTNHKREGWIFPLQIKTHYWSCYD
jgi:hypothetical protein